MSPLGAANPGGTQPLDPRTAGAGGPMAIAASYVSIDPEKVRAVAVPLYAVLAAGASTSGTDAYRVPTTHDFVIEEIKAHIVITDLAAEPASPAGASDIGLPGLGDRLALKAMNAEFDLRNIDREQRIVDNHRMTISALMTIAGGEPLKFGMTPHKILAGETIRLDVALINTTSDFASGAARYGVILVGKLVRVARS